MFNIPKVTKNLLLVNVIMFVFTLINEDFMFRTFALFYPASPLFKPWQIVTHMFMHGNLMHIFFNMYSLFLFGSEVERSIGPKKFLVFYFVTGIGAALLHLGVQHLQFAAYANNFQAAINMLRTPTVGASGAVYGVLIGFAMLYPDSVLTLIFPPVSLKAKWLVLIFAGIELATGIFVTTDGVAHFAHLGGMLFGWLLMLYWKKYYRLYNRDKWI